MIFLFKNVFGVIYAVILRYSIKKDFRPREVNKLYLPDPVSENKHKVVPNMCLVLSCPEIGLHKSRKMMEELLRKKSSYFKPITGLKMSCKSILGLSMNM